MTEIQSALGTICEELWFAAEGAIKPLGDERYYFNDYDRTEAITAMKARLQELLAA